MIRHIIRLCFKIPGVRGIARRIYNAHVEDFKADRALDVGIVETTPLYIRKSSLKGRRLNLIVPALSSQHVFGGISTAINFFLEIGKGCDNLRIILSDESGFYHGANPNFDDWVIKKLGDADVPGRVIVSAGSRDNRLAVAPGDVFVATAWWTSFLVSHIRDAQAAIYNLDVAPRYAYLIQDFEPGFYPWSSRYALAESTYHVKDDCVAVFNSKILADFFVENGYAFENKFYFDPSLHRELRAEIKKVDSIRKRKVLVYGRPGVARNGFELIVMALKEWCRNNKDASKWEFVSAGESHPDVDLGNGVVLRSLGKLTIDEYASQLLECYTGVSIMVSPHPSYPPLEMAAFGLRVITNGYDSKNLSELSDSIVSVKWLSPNSIAMALEELLSSYENNSMPYDVNSPWFLKYISGEEAFEEISVPIRALLCVESTEL